MSVCMIHTGSYHLEGGERCEKVNVIFFWPLLFVTRYVYVLFIARRGEKKNVWHIFFFVCTYSSLWSPWQFAPNANGLCWSSVCHLFVPPSAVVAIFRSPDKFSSTYEQLIVECIRNEEPVGNFRNAVFTVEKCFGIILLYVCADAILRTNGETAGEA